MMKNVRLVLNQDTFLWIKNKEGLVYQSKNYQAFTFTLSDSLFEICSYLLEIEHLYTVILSEELLSDTSVRYFVDQLIIIDAGKLILDNDSTKDLVSLMPIIKIHDQIEDFIWKHEQGIGGKLILHIHELSFYINESKYGNDHYHKQFFFPCIDAPTLKSEKIIRFIRNSKNLHLSNINLIGNIFSYPTYTVLLNHIFNFEIPVTIYITFDDLVVHISQLKNIEWNNLVKFNILIDKISTIDKLSTLLNDIVVPYSITCLFFSENDIFDFERIQTSFDIQMIPIFNGENITFFESNVFVNKNDILSANLSKREVFMRQVTNVNHFGKLTIMTDGKVYSDVNQVSLGTIDDTPYSIVYKEFVEGKTWFRIRNQAPCNDCIFQWLCPSPSNYETVIGSQNLCFVK